MSAVEIPYTSRADWLEKRRAGIGGSDIAGIMGLSPYHTPLQVWASKLANIDEDGDEVMAWGSRLEPVILDTWQAEPGRHPVTRRGVLLANEQRPWMMATLDGETVVGKVDLDGAGPVRRVDWEPAIVQAKNIGDWAWSDVPQHYRIQVEWEMAVAGYDRAFLAVLHGGRKLETYEQRADPDLRAELINAGLAFWRDYVKTEEPPPIEAEDLAFLMSMWPTSEEFAVEIPVEVADEMYVARAEYQSAKARWETASAQIRGLMTKADTAVVGQKVIATWRAHDERRIDVGRLRAEMPDVAKRFEVVGNSRPFLIKGDKL